MKVKLVTLAGLVCVIMIGLGLSSEWSELTVKDIQTEAAQRPIVLELYTSQGCSSCPPAEAVLSKFASDKKNDGLLIPLAFHVDYWNYLGWIDPYSSPEWTDRQSDYRERMGGATLYTPQLVIQGQHEMIGSDETQIKRHIEKIRNDTAPMLYGVDIESARYQNERLMIKLRPVVTDTMDNEMVILVTVIFENATPTDVAGGENAGRTLANKYVVRALDKQVMERNSEMSKKVYHTEVTPEPEWRMSDLGVAAWVQDAQTLEIYGADVVKSVELLE